MSGKVTASSRMPHLSLLRKSFSRACRRAGSFAIQFLHHRVVTPVRKRMASHQPPHTHQTAAHRAIALHSLHGIFGAGGNVAAGRRKHRRDRPLIASQQLKRDEFGKRSHSIRFSFPASGFRNLVLVPTNNSPAFFLRASVLLLRRRGSLRSLPRRSRSSATTSSD